MTSRFLLLPMHTALGDDDVHYICDVHREILWPAWYSEKVKDPAVGTDKPTAVAGGQRTPAERLEAGLNRECFERNPASWEDKIANFPKYVRRQNLTRFLALYELFKLVLPVKGSVIECGVHDGFGVMTWARLSGILEPVNLMRRVYGFDTFQGFPSLSDRDRTAGSSHVQAGDLFANSHDEILRLCEINDSTRLLGHVPKVELIRG